jgi:hypothetical protein
MWKLKFASKLAGGPQIPGVTQKSNKRIYARYAGLASAGCTL